MLAFRFTWILTTKKLQFEIKEKKKKGKRKEEKSRGEMVYTYIYVIFFSAKKNRKILHKEKKNFFLNFIFKNV